MFRAALVAVAALHAAGCATAPGAEAESDLPPLARAAFENNGTIPPDMLAKAIADAANKPLGSRANPVRAEMPDGQVAYLERLRCADGATPTHERIGAAGFGVFGTIIDAYAVMCAGGRPRPMTVFMDMYHRRHVEAAPVPGFTITPAIPF